MRFFKPGPNGLLIVALIYLLAGGGLPSGLALCLGYDGHVAFETLAQAGGCASELEDGPSCCACESKAFEVCDHCGSCIDIAPLSSGKVSNSTFSSFLFVAFSRFPAGMHDAAIPSSRTIPPDVPLFVSSLAALRTTVLLI